MTKELFRQIVGESLGEASMAWSETPKGIFDSSKCVELCEKIMNAHLLALAEERKSAIDEIKNIIKAEFEKVRLK